MTALLSVSKSDTSKVANYAGDCRKMGIEVLPPDFIHSDWDFSIQDRKGEDSAIRFGLGAVKNVGHDPVAAIMEGRKSGPVSTLGELGRAIDFRRVGKRALESLIKVGAMDDFGKRHSLVQAVEQIISLSGSHFRAKESGQLALFSGQVDLGQEIQLTESQIDPEIARRELLAWERDLIGLYVSDHPLRTMEDELSKVITHFSHDLMSLEPNSRVRVAGLVTAVRVLQTKNGKTMAFATLEDTRGEMDLVIFPKTWQKYSELVTHDRVLIVEGKLDAQESSSKILVDKIDTQVTVSVSTENKDENNPQVDSEKPVKPKTTRQNFEKVSLSEETNSVISKDIPEPPDVFPADWQAPHNEKESANENDNQQSEIPKENEVPEIAIKVQEPMMAHKISDAPRDQSKSEKQDSSPIDVSEAATSFQNPERNLDSDLSSIPESSSPIPFISPPQKSSSSENDSPKMLTIVLRSSGDHSRDILHLRRVHGTLISYPGEDHFAFYVIEGSSGYLLEFPNDTTNFNNELKRRL
jgi:DNA polymerase-3 subunit alpha